MRAANKPEYVTGTGQKLWKIHLPEQCEGRPCVIHNPTTKKPECDWPTHWRADRRLMERICPCGIGHPAGEHLEYLKELDEKLGTDMVQWEGIHGCGLGCHTPGWCEEQKILRELDREQVENGG